MLLDCAAMLFIFREQLLPRHGHKTQAQARSKFVVVLVSTCKIETRVVGWGVQISSQITRVYGRFKMCIYTTCFSRLHNGSQRFTPCVFYCKRLSYFFNLFFRLHISFPHNQNRNRRDRHDNGIWNRREPAYYQMPEGSRVKSQCLQNNNGLLAEYCIVHS